MDNKRVIPRRLSNIILVKTCIIIVILFIICLSGVFSMW